MLVLFAVLHKADGQLRLNGFEFQRVEPLQLIHHFIEVDLRSGRLLKMHFAQQLLEIIANILVFDSRHQLEHIG